MEDCNSTESTSGLFADTPEEIVLLATAAFLAFLVCVLLLVVLGLYRYIQKLRMTSKSNSRLISSFTKSSVKDTAAGTYETVGNAKQTVVQQQPNVSRVVGHSEACVRSECDNGNVPDVKEKGHKEITASTEEKGKDKDIEREESIKKAKDDLEAIVEIPDPDKGIVRYAKINKNKPSVVRDPDPEKAVADTVNNQTDITSAATDSEP